METAAKSTHKIETLFWNMIYTSPKMEKKVYTELCNSSIEAFLPLKKSLRQWSDRKKVVELPLFSQYIFVRVNPITKWKALNIKGALKYVNFGGEYAKVKDDVIDSLKLISEKQSNSVTIETAPLIQAGVPVEIKQGIFKGLQGEVIFKNGKKKLFIKIEAIGSMCCIDYESLC